MSTRRVEVSDNHKSSSGSWCVFVKLSETEGVKLYHRPEIRDAAAKLQDNAHRLGVGPAVGEFCEMPYLTSWDRPRRWDKQPEKVYGYITQIAKDVGKCTKEEMEFLTELMGSFGMDTRDMYSDNMGWLDGYPVCIDFDPAFFGRDPGLLAEIGCED